MTDADFRPTIHEGQAGHIRLSTLTRGWCIGWTYRRTKTITTLHVRGYKEEGTITTAFDMTVLNDLDRFHLVMDVVDRLPQTGSKGTYLKQKLQNKLIEHKEYIDKQRAGHARDSRMEVVGIKVSERSPALNPNPNPNLNLNLKCVRQARLGLRLRS